MIKMKDRLVNYAQQVWNQPVIKKHVLLLTNKQESILNVPVDFVPMVVEVTLEQKKIVMKLQVYLGGRVRQRILSRIRAYHVVVLNTMVTCTSIQKPPPQYNAPPLTSVSVN